MTFPRRRAATLLCATVLTMLIAQPAAAADWPLRPRPEMVHGFERPPSPWLPGHRGVDLAGSPGQPVLSAAPGTISYAGQLAGRGVVVVSHGQTRTTYEPVVASVGKGATVAAGQAIGRLSAAGSHCAPAACLHWGLRRGEEYLDPLSLLGAGPVRLLPLSGSVSASSGAEPGSPAITPRESGNAAAEVASEASSTAGRDDPTRSGTTDAPARIVVALAAAATIGSGLLIRRH
jgi:peptidase M23-like protein